MSESIYFYKDIINTACDKTITKTKDIIKEQKTKTICYII